MLLGCQHRFPHDATVSKQMHAKPHNNAILPARDKLEWIRAVSCLEIPLSLMYGAHVCHVQLIIVLYFIFTLSRAHGPNPEARLQ